MGGFADLWDIKLIDRYEEHTVPDPDYHELLPEEAKWKTELVVVGKQYQLCIGDSCIFWSNDGQEALKLMRDFIAEGASAYIELRNLVARHEVDKLKEHVSSHENNTQGDTNG